MAVKSISSSSAGRFVGKITKDNLRSEAIGDTPTSQRSDAVRLAIKGERREERESQQLTYKKNRRNFQPAPLPAATTYTPSTPEATDGRPIIGTSSGSSTEAAVEKPVQSQSSVAVTRTASKIPPTPKLTGGSEILTNEVVAETKRARAAKSSAESSAPDYQIQEIAGNLDITATILSSVDGSSPAVKVGIGAAGKLTIA